MRFDRSADQSEVEHFSIVKYLEFPAPSGKAGKGRPAPNFNPSPNQIATFHPDF
jgi:hypothetical protein